MTDLNVENVVKTQIQAMIIQAFKDAPEAIDALVEGALNQEVNEYGGKPDYRDQKMPYLTFLCRTTIQDVARAAVREHVESIKDEIKDRVKAQLSSDQIAEAFLGPVAEAINQDWRINVNFAAEQDR